jgi:hypothetical protein
MASDKAEINKLKKVNEENSFKINEKNNILRDYSENN